MFPGAGGPPEAATECGDEKPEKKRPQVGSLGA
jgi:hypothetical protein